MNFRFASVLLAPTLALASVTGSVTLLDGTPVTGAVVKSQTDSVVTTASGTFALGRTSGITSRSAKTIPVTSHLTVENGRPRLSFAGMDIAGRARFAATTRQNLSNTGIGLSARSASTQDTLKVYWKGKRLTVLPVTSDTTVTFYIDTAWKDDAGIPWNPSITYGSLFDSRDGQTYRTVTIGSQTWMAENLNYAWGNSTDSFCIDGDNVVNGIETPVSDCRSSNAQLYSWSEAMKIDTIYNITSWKGNSSKGLCPEGWHVPNFSEWRTPFPSDSTFGSLDSSFMEYCFSSANWAKAGSDWNDPGSDTRGFHLTPLHIKHFTNSIPTLESRAEYLWTSNQYAIVSGATPKPEFFSGIHSFVDQDQFPAINGHQIEGSRSPTAMKHWKSSLRCLKD